MVLARLVRNVWAFGRDIGGVAMSRRAMVFGALMAVLLLTLLALDVWSEWKDLPSPGYVWRELQNAPGLTALVVLAFVSTFVVFCAWSVGFGRWEKVALVVLFAGAAVSTVGAWGGAALARYDWSGPVTPEGADRFLTYMRAVVLVLTFGGTVFFVGSAVLVMASAVRTWQHRKRVFPFFYKSRE